MLLAVDVGNTNMVFGIYEGDKLAGSFRLKTDASRTGDEIGLLATQYFEKFGLDANRVEAVIIASMLPNVELAAPDKVLNCTAVGQIQAGAVLGYIGAMEYLIRRTKQEMGYPEGEIKVVATGGLSRMVADNTDLIDLVDENLILDGLRIIYRRYQGEKA